MHAVAATYHVRPSEILGIRNRVTAYKFDVAVLTVVSQPAEDSPAPDQRAPAGAAAPRRSGKQYAPMGHLVNRVAELQPDGTWKDVKE